MKILSSDEFAERLDELHGCNYVRGIYAGKGYPEAEKEMFEKTNRLRKEILRHYRELLKELAWKSS